MEVKEIVIDSYPGYVNKTPYKDSLKISKNWISYKKYYLRYPGLINELPKDIKWDYKTDNEAFESLFHAAVQNIDYGWFSPMIAMDAPGFTIEIKYYDGSKKEIHYDYLGIDLENDSLQHLFYLIRRMIPQGEELPFYLRPQEIDDVNERDLDEFLSELNKGTKINYYEMPSWVYKMMFNFLERDFEYSSNIDINVAHHLDSRYLSFKEIKAYVTMITREEHFGEGAIAEFVNSGEALGIMNRLKELLDEQ